MFAAQGFRATKQKVEFDASSSSGTLTVAAPLAYVVVGMYIDASTNTDAKPSSVTCGGTEMTYLGGAKIPNVYGGAHLYGLSGVSSGDKTITITLSTGTLINQSAASYTGVISAGNATTNTAAGTTNFQVSTSSVPGNGLAVAYLTCGNNANITWGGYTTLRVNHTRSAYLESNVTTTFTGQNATLRPYAGVSAILSP